MKQIIDSRDQALLLVRHLNLMSDVVRGIDQRVSMCCSELTFPVDPLSIRFEIEQYDAALHLRFYVNGNKEELVLPVGPNLKPWESLSKDITDSVRILPWRLLILACRTIGKPVETANEEFEVPNFGNEYETDPFAFAFRPVSKGKHDLTYLKSFYGYVYPAWKHGANVYKSNSSYQTWRETVKSEIEAELRKERRRMGNLMAEPKVFARLVERFAPVHRDRVSEIQTELKDRRLKPTPGDLALDHAAHLCGVPLYEYSIRHLKDLKSDRGSRGRKRTQN